MNYYEHHLGDYAAATAHLSWDEDLAYTRILRAYYHHEKPLPLDAKEVCRLVRASTSSQRRAVDAVLREFFVKQSDGWHQKRCDEEIARYQDKCAKAKGSANARWSAKRSDSEGNANASETHSERNADNDANALRTQSEGNAPNLQSPDSSPNLQTPVSRDGERARGTRLPPDWELTPKRREVAEAENLDPDRTFGKFTSYWEAASGRTACKRDWDAAWRYWCREERDRKPKNGTGGQQPSAPVKYRTADEIEAEERARGDYDAQH